MHPSTVIHIQSLSSLRRSPATRNSSTNGGALLGWLRVAERTEKYTVPPFYIPAGRLVFSDNISSQQNNAFSPTKSANALSGESLDEMIRCEVLCPQPSWFATNVIVLFTEWRYISPPPTLSGEEAIAWAYIEALTPPILLPLSLHVPTTDRPLSWWIEHQIDPDADTEKHFIGTFQTFPPVAADSAARMLEFQKDKHKGNNDSETNGAVSVMGRVVALSSLVCSVSDDNGGETPMKFLVDVELDYAASGNEANSAKINKKVPVLVIGKRFLSQFVSLYVDDSVFVTRLNPATLYVDGSKAEPVFTTTDMSEIIKVNGLECLDDIYTRLSCSPQTTFTQESQEALLYSVSSDGPKDATGNSSNNVNLTHSPQHHNTVSQGSRSQARHFSGDNHLLVNKGRLESYSGEITSIVDFTLGIYVIDGVHLLVLSYWPLLSPLLPLRKGTRVVIDNVHIILLSNSACYSWQWFDKIPHLQQHAGVDDDKRRVLVFGACSRSSIRILEFPTSDAPSNLPCILDRSIIAEVVGRSSGLVQMIEGIEAYWNLQIKFPAGPLNTTTTVDKRSNAQLIEMALTLTKGQDHSKANAAPCNLCTEFLSHSNCCSVDSSVVAEPLRVVTLRTIIQRFINWQNSQSDTDAGSRNDSTNEHSPDHQAKGDIGEVQVVKVYLSSLQLEKIPIIGRVVVNDRGSICIQDSTGTIRILPNFRPKEDHASTIYPSQQHIGHVYVWKSWYFINESVDVAAVLGKGGRSLGMQLVPEGSVFSLVYASVSDSLVLHTDDTFGGMVPTTPSVRMKRKYTGTRRLSSMGMSHCFVFLVRSATSQLCRANSTDDEAWQERMSVSGVAFKADFEGVHLQHLSQKQPASAPEMLDLGAVDEKKLDDCVLVYALGKVPALLEPGTAYVLCLSNLPHPDSPSGRISTGRSISGNGPVTYVRLGKHDHIHPVRVTIRSPSIELDQSYGDRMFDVPVLVAQAASEHAFDRLKSSTIYSVRDILSRCSGTADSRLQPGDTVTVTGVVSRRELLEATAFASSAGVTKPDDGPLKERSRKTAVTGCFKTLVVLQDHGDATHEILLYIKLKSFSHPAGIVPGAHASVRNVTLGVSRSTGKPYLTATAVTNIQALLRHEMPSFCDGFSDDTDAESIVIPFIGQLYTQQRFQHRKISLSGCYIDNVFSIQIMVICATCGQAVCNMQCCCGTKSARALKELPSEPRARGGMYADVSMTAHVSDGSGIALICASGADALCEVLQISPENMEALYRASAQALDGKLVWRQQRWAPDEANQLSEEQGMLGFMVAAAARTAIICIEGVLQSVEMPADEAACSVVKQTVRLGGQDIVVNRYATVTVATRRVVRIAVADLCWKMLGEL